MPADVPHQQVGNGAAAATVPEATVPTAIMPAATVPAVTMPPAQASTRRGRSSGRGWLVASRIVLGILCAITVMTLALGAALRLDDRAITAHRGTATATVLTVSALRTGIEYVNGAGVAVRPSRGVLYPGLLTVGQRFLVEYSTVDPEVVRVAGRTAAVGNVGLISTLVISWLVGLPLVWQLLRTGHRPRPPAGRRTRATR